MNKEEQEFMGLALGRTLELLEEREKEVKVLASALETIRSKNGLQYSDIFAICDKALRKEEKP